ncbi:hypothetical protein CXB51_008449 [Gossypium anomalum]|uniref:Aminotransferase-like plant mobile domain-containing protein n=1 Tax=Gossypium anomalum TaxID=47600 RepID=A0A8J5ZSQ2_9ROSI|nr:hypothetical protein CXB51_008449 [Gossypium anomalum]
MAGELIRLDHKHISVEQMKMSADRVLQCYIRNISGPPSSLIENYLREAGFWHATTIGRGCKLDPKFISALIERWRPETHTFHLPFGAVDEDVLTESVQSADWGVICYSLLDVISDNIYGGQIEMSWLRDTFLELGNDSTKLERIRYARAYILKMIGGYLMPDLSRNLVHLRWLLKLVDFRIAGELSWDSTVLATLYREMCRATPSNKAKIGGGTIRRVMLEYLPPSKIYGFIRPTVRSTPYEDLAIRAVIPDEFFQNQNIWHVKVPLVNYAIVKMHQTDRVLRQFEFQQLIPEELENISKFGNIGMIIYLIANRSSSQS